MTSARGTKAAVYTRISSDKDGDALGVARQQQDCEALATKLGLTVVETYSDNSISAASGKHRPEYEAMLEAARAGQFDYVIAYSNSRLTRRLMDLETLIQLHEKHGTVIQTVVSGQDDLSTADGRMVARIKASVDAAEAERTGERLKRQKAQRVADGLPLGGRFRTFGFNRDWTHNEEEAEAVREAYRRSLAGESLLDIERDFNERGIHSTSGNPWKRTGLSRSLTNPMYAGFMTSKGQITGKGAFEPIVDEATYQAYIISRKMVKKGATARKYLLTGILHCGKCLLPMVGKPAKGGVESYVCRQDKQGCGGIHVKAAFVDEAVTNAVWFRMQTEGLPEPEETTRDYDAELEAVDAEIKALREANTTGALELQDLIPMLAAKREQRSSIIKAQGEQVTTSALGNLIMEMVTFNDESLSARQAYLRRSLRQVVIAPGAGRGHKSRIFDRSRLTVVWADGTQEVLSKETGTSTIIT